MITRILFIIHVCPPFSQKGLDTLIKLKEFKVKDDTPTLRADLIKIEHKILKNYLKLYNLNLS